VVKHQEFSGMPFLKLCVYLSLVLVSSASLQPKKAWSNIAILKGLHHLEKCCKDWQMQKFHQPLSLKKVDTLGGHIAAWFFLLQTRPLTSNE
jgi:hypothetical protein